MFDCRRVADRRFAATMLLTILTGCAATPMGPMVQVMPAPNKPFSEFLADQKECKVFAEGQVDGQASAANKGAAAGALLITGLGGASGGMIGMTTGTPGSGAVVGAAYVATNAGSSGLDVSRASNPGIQVQYDNAYVQCMYVRGHQVPGFAPIEAAQVSSPHIPAPGELTPAK